MYSISVDGSSVDRVSDRVQPPTYAAIAVKAPRYCQTSVNWFSKSSILLTRTLKMTAAWRLLGDTMLSDGLASAANSGVRMPEVDKSNGFH